MPLAEPDAHEKPGHSPDRASITRLLQAADAAEDAGQLAEMEALAREGLAQALAAEAADLVVDFYAILGRMGCLHEEWSGVVRESEPGLAWLPRAQDAVACVRLAGMLSTAYLSLGQLDRAFGLMQRVRTLPVPMSHEAAFLLEAGLGDLNLRLGRTARAARHQEAALRMLAACAAERQTAHRTVMTRLVLAAALLLTATAERKAGSPDWAAPLSTVMQHLDEAERLLPQVPVLAVSFIVTRGWCLALMGQPDPALKARFTALPDDELGQVVYSTEPCLFEWAAVEAAAGDVGFARSVLARTDPQSHRLLWPQLKPLWFRTLGAVLAADADWPGAVAALQKGHLEDQRNRDREIATVVEMAERAAQADEIQQREQAERDRADQLAIRNASLAAETQRWSHSALTDALTGLRNRRYLEQAAAEVQSASPVEDRTVVMIDIDHFKSINDEHSHAVGDQVLAAVGRILAASVRDHDIAARWGGEEFVLLLRRQVDERRLDAIRCAVASFDWASLLPGRNVTVSLGAAMWSGERPFAAVLALADERLYVAKRAGRNRVVAG